MCKNKSLILLLGFISLIVSPSLSFASLTMFYDPVTFANQGSIVENYGYDDFSAFFSFPGNPWTAHGVKYNSGHNLIIGTGTSYSPISNVLANDAISSPIKADINAASQFDMFGIDLGYLIDSSKLSITIFTNLSTYTYSNLNVPKVNTGFNFYGAVANSGEFFTGFNVASSSSTSFPAIDNVRLGNAQSVVPEPATMSLLGLGLLGVVFRRKRSS